jgi:dTMP kinase
MRRGSFFVFEGADGVGKTTQAKLLSEYIRGRHGLDVLLLREPGGTKLGERVRQILLDPSSGRIETPTELFLFMAARSHLVREKILPALEEGLVVVCDRYLWSSAVYQGIAGGLGSELVLRIGRLAAAAKPMRTFLIDTPLATACRRTAGVDRMESRGRSFQEKVRRGFLELARRHPRGVEVIDGRGSPEDVHRRVVGRLPDGWPEGRP